MQVDLRRTWLPTLGLSLTTIVVLATLGWSATESWRAFVARQETARAALATSLAARVEVVLHGVEGDLRVLRDAVAADRRLVAADVDRLGRSVAAAIGWNPAIGAINVFDAAGVLVASSAPRAPIGVVLKGSERFEQLRAAPGLPLQFSTPLFSALLGERVFSATLGLTDVEGRFNGMIGALIPIRRLLAPLADLKPGPHVRVGMFGTDGRRIVEDPDHADDGAGLQAEDARIVWRVLADRETAEIVAPAGLLDAPGHTSLRRVERYPLVVAASSVDRMVAAAWWEEERGMLIAYSLLGLIVVVFNGRAIGRAIATRRQAAIDADALRHAASRVTRSETRASDAIEALRASEARFRDGIEAMDQAFALYDQDDRLATWNARYIALMPVTADKMRVGEPFPDLIDRVLRDARPELDEAGRRAVIRERLAARAAKSVVEFETPEKRILRGIDRATSEGGHVEVFQDVTESRALLARITASESRFRDFAETASDWFWETDADLRCSYLSNPFHSRGSDSSLHLGRRRSDEFLADGLEVPAELVDIEARMARREAFRGLVFPARRSRDAEPMMIEVSGKPVFADDGGFVGYRGTASDVTERIRQRAAIERALAVERETNLQQRRFVSIASHEFRTPLAIIDGATQRIAAKLGRADTDVSKRLDRIRGAVSRMTEMIERTLSSARLDAGRVEFQPVAIELHALLEAVCQRQQQISPDFEFVLGGASVDTTVEGDRRLIEQVVTNLLSNAVKYSGLSRRIDVTIEPGDTVVSFAVRDRGVGIPAEEVPKLFTRFFRASTAEGIPGTGIGLNLVREFVTLHGGTIDVVSAVGRGSTFTVRLPRRVAPARHSEAAD